MLPSKLTLHTPDVVVLQQGDTVVIKRRAVTNVGIAAVALGAAALLYAGHTWVPLTHAPALLWLAVLLAVAGGLNLFAAAVVRGQSITWDHGAQQIRRGRRTWPLASILSVAVQDFELMGSPIARVVAQRNDGAINITPGVSRTHRDAAVALAEALHASLNLKTRAAPTSIRSAGPKAASRNPARGFHIALPLILGALWAVAGYLLMPTAVFRPPGSGITTGVLAWPFGLWIAALGVLEWAGVAMLTPLSVQRRESPKATPWRALLLMASWIGSYMVTCGTWWWD